MHELLPKGWYLKTQSHRQSTKFIYLSDVFEIIVSSTNALYALKNNGKSTTDEINKFLSLLNPKKVSEERLVCDEKSEALPTGWKILTCPTNKQRHYVISD